MSRPVVDLSALPPRFRGRLYVGLTPAARRLGAILRTSTDPLVELSPDPPADPDLWKTSKTFVRCAGGAWIVEHFDRHGGRAGS